MSVRGNVSARRRWRKSMGGYGRCTHCCGPGKDLEWSEESIEALEILNRVYRLVDKQAAPANRRD